MQFHAKEALKALEEGFEAAPEARQIAQQIASGRLTKSNIGRIPELWPHNATSTEQHLTRRMLGGPGAYEWALEKKTA
jgi:hypothetical protein